MLSMLLSEQKTPSLQMMEAIARVAKVPPSYFLEWRAALVAQVVERALLAWPVHSMRAWNQVRAVVEN